MRITDRWRRIRNLMWVVSGADEGGGDGTGTPAGSVGTPGPDGHDDDLGFPTETPVDDMTIEQKAAYWKYQSRKHEAREKKHADYDELAAKAAELDKLQEKNKTDQEKALDDARRQGENIGAERYLAAAVRGEIRATAPHLDAEKVDELMSIIDPQRCVNDDGDVDTEKVAKIISSLAPEQPAPTPKVRLSDTLNGSRPGGKNAGSVAELQSRYLDQLKPHGGN